MAQKFKNQIDAQEGIKITNELYDGSNAAGTSGQVLSSTGTGTQWIDSSADTAERIEVTVKNVSGGSLSKGTVVHASPTATPPSGNVIEVIAADYDTASAMPAIGVLNETIANEAEGAAVMMGAVSGIDTDSFNIGDELYVGNAGAFTNSKPTANNQLIQKMAVVIKKHASNGLIKIFGAGRSNDVPNQIDRNVNFTDNSKLTFGDSTTPDLEIYHDTGNSVIKDNGTGSLYIMGSSSIRLTNVGAGEHYAKFFENGAVELMYDNSKKFETTSAGVSVTGDITFGDSSKAIFGAGNDLQIFHNAVDSYSAVIDSGTGYLLLGSDGPFILIGNSTATETYIKANNNGSVDLHYDNSKKLETTTYGINVISKASINDTISGNFTTNYDTRVLVGGEIIARSLTANESMVSIGGDSTSAFVKSGKQDGSLTARDLRFVRGQDEKLRVTSTGIDVTGDINIENTTPSLKLTDSDGGYTEFAANNTDLVIKVDPDNVVGSSTIQFEIDGSEYMRIATTGNVGIGTTSPDKKLEVSGDIKISGGDYNGLYFENASGTTKSLLYQHASYDALVIKDIVNNADRFTFTNSGNLGIGTTSPAYKLDITGNSTSGVIAVRNSANGRDTFRSENASGTRTVNIGNDGNGHGILLVRGAGGTTTNYIAGNGDSYFNGGDVGIGTTSPGAKLDVNGDAKFSDNITMTKSSGNNQLYMNSSGGGAPVIYMEDPSRKWGQYVSSGHLHFKDETANIVSLKIDGATSAATFAGSVDVNGSEITVGTNNSRFAENNLRFLSSGTAYIDHNTVGQSFVFRTSDASSLDTTALTIASNGNATFAGDITLEQAATPTIELKDTTNNYYLLLRHNNTNAIFDTHSSSYYEFKIGDSEKMRINNNGNVGIGTTSPSTTLETVGIIQTTGNGASFMFEDRVNSGNKWEWFSAYNKAGLYKNHNTAETVMTIDSSGNVGIGTTSPAVQLHISSSSSTFAQVRVEAGADGYDSSVAYSQAGTIKGISGYDDSTDTVAIKYGTFGGNGIDIDSSGNVGIGTDSPSNKLEVNGNIAVKTTGGNSGIKIITASDAEGFLIFGDADDNSMGGMAYNNSTNTLSIDCNNAERMTINSSGNVGINTTSPDSKLDVTGGDITVNTTGTGFMNFKYSGSQMGTIGTDGIDLKITANADLQILPTGNVGIGTTTPSNKLEVNGNIAAIASNATISATESGGATTKIMGASVGRVGTSSNHNLEILSNNIAAITIDTSQNSTFSGNITASAGTITASGRITGASISAAGGFLNGSAGGIRVHSSGTKFFNITEANAARDNIMDIGASDARFKDLYLGGNIQAAGNVGIGVTSATHQLHVHTATDNDYALRVEGSTNNAAGVWTGIGIAGESANTKSAIIYEDIGVSYARGKLHFCINNEQNQNSASPSDAIMTISNDGNVGIGLTDPAVKLEIQDSTHTTMKIRSGNNDNILFAQAIQSSDARIGTDTNTDLSFYTNASERMRINSVGNVSIGSTTGYSPNLGGAVRLKVTSSANENSNIVIENANNGTSAASALVLGSYGADFTIRHTSAAAGGDLIFTRGTNERMRINSSGQVGINVTNPNNALEVRATSDGTHAGIFTPNFINSSLGACGTTLLVQSQKAVALNLNRYYSFGTIQEFRQNNDLIGYFNVTSGALTLATAGARNLAFTTNGSERMHVTSSGAVGIGISNPSYDLHVVATIGTRVLKLGHGVGHARITTDDASKPLDLQINSQNALRIATNKDIGIGDDTPSYKLDVAGVIRATGDIIAFSDKRVKENIKTIENSLDKVDKLRGVEFNKIGEDKKSIGVIAQEIEEILPEVVSTDDDGMKSVAYGNITGVLIEAIKELKAEVEELKKQIK